MAHPDCPKEEPFQSFIWATLGNPCPLQVSFPVSGPGVSPAWCGAGISGPASYHPPLAAPHCQGAAFHPSCNISAAGHGVKAVSQMPAYVATSWALAIITPGWLPLQRNLGRIPQTSLNGPRRPCSPCGSVPLCRDSSFLVDSFCLFCKYFNLQVIG